ncbi:NUDIX domain-containing protein [Lentzea waywayandensis]|uniref:NUDIX domain-containing protein n=2 Tax=Lentzea TaxID=165301 RepID=A0A1I6EEP8_9PSEU|nr:MULTISPECIES: NUDIX domain-containing protein [Lentzea]MDX8143863.1 NUDIX domain-containing protein [Lentzea sp. BCCO 10_0061]SFR16008.1 NUDIX domain-containing protein [Lentzea waywayandensis]
MARDDFCNSCGSQYADTAAYPRRCASCGHMVWANPSPVVVLLVPVKDGPRTGLLTVRRAIPPVGELAFVSGFMDRGESWQQSAVRELEEEAGVRIPPDDLRPLHFVSTPDGGTVLMFATAPAINAEDMPPFVPNDEASERAIIFECVPLAFPLHNDVATKYFSTEL